MDFKECLDREVVKLYTRIFVQDTLYGAVKTRPKQVYKRLSYHAQKADFYSFFKDGPIYRGERVYQNTRWL